MPRKKKKPGYNPEVSMEELVSAIAHAYGSYDDRKEDVHDPSLIPYDSAAYKLSETSVEADRAKTYRIRSAAVRNLCRHIMGYWDKEQKQIQTEKEMLWKCVLAFEGYRFKTAKGLPFTYSIKMNRGGEKSGELIFSRKSKGVTRATAELAYDRVVVERSSQNDILPVMTTPKKLNVFGASYLYAMFIRFELVRPE